MGQLSRKDLLKVLEETNRGFTDLLKHYERLGEEDRLNLSLLEKMTVNEALDFLKVHSNLIRTPVIIEGDKTCIGYNPEQIRMFLPKTYRRTLTKKLA